VEASTVNGRPEVVMHGLKERPRGWLEWLTTTDHKKIGLLYLFTTFLFFVIGGVEALLMRLQLGGPDGTLLDPETYNSLVTMHGTTMVFLFIVPVLASSSSRPRRAGPSTPRCRTTPSRRAPGWMPGSC
jgi:cytochrome c oxidase subunit 1